MNGMDVISNQSAAIYSGKNMSATDVVPPSWKYRIGVHVKDPLLETCERCNFDRKCNDVPISKNWYLLCEDCEKYIVELVKKEVTK